MLVDLYSAQISTWFVTRAFKHSEVCHCMGVVTWVGELQATAPPSPLWIRPCVRVCVYIYACVRCVCVRCVCVCVCVVNFLHSYVTCACSGLVT